MANRTTLVGAALLLVACGADPGDDLDDEKTSTTTAALDVGASAASLDGLDAADPAKAAAHLAASTKESCKTRTVDPANPNIVHVTLDACGGRFDRHVVSGHLTVTFSANADGSLHAETVSEDLTIDGRAFSRKVSEDIRFDGDQRTVTRHSEKTGTKKNGDSLEQSQDAVIVFDRATRCRTENGTGRALVAGSREIAMTTADLRTCEADDGQEYCPTGTIEHVNKAKGKTRTVTFDGTTVATIEVSKRKGDTSSTWTLACVAR